MTNQLSHANPLQPFAATIKDAARFAGWTRSEIYRRLAAGDIRGVKNGRRTLVLMESVRAYLAALPPATFREPSKRTAA